MSEHTEDSGGEGAWRHRSRRRRHSTGEQSRELRGTPSVRPALPRREMLVAFLATVYLLFSALAYSSVPLWTQWTSLALAMLTFAALFVPVGFDGWRSKPPLESLRALCRFPVFWLGVALFVLMAIQGLNADWLVVVRTFRWQLFPEEHIAWLPAGVAAPFTLDQQPGGMNAFRQMIIFGGPWLVLCALWVGVERRRLWVVMGWVLVLAGMLLAGWGAEMRISHQRELDGVYNIANTSFFGSFLYQNQAGAWLSLQYAIAVALAIFHWENAVARAARSGPHLLGAGVALIIALGTVFTLSFGGMLTLTVLLLVVTPAAVLWALFRQGLSLGLILGGALVAGLLAVVVGIFAATADLSQVDAKLQSKFKLAQQNALDDRAPLRRATWAMVTHNDNDKLLFGYGAGSYRWVSPHFLRAEKKFQNKAGQLAFRANYAHCDWLQILAEWGAAGAALVLAGLGWLGWTLARNIRRWTPATPVLVSAGVLFMLHAGMDFLIYNIPLLSLAFFVALAAIRLTLRHRNQE